MILQRQAHRGEKRAHVVNRPPQKIKRQNTYHPGAVGSLRASWCSQTQSPLVSAVRERNRGRKSLDIKGDRGRNLGRPALMQTRSLDPIGHASSNAFLKGGLKKLSETRQRIKIEDKSTHVFLFCLRF